TGRGRSSGKQKKLQGHSPALMRAAASSLSSAATGSTREVIRLRNTPPSSPSGAQSSSSWLTSPSCSSPHGQAKRTQKTTGCPVPASGSSVRNEDSDTRLSPCLGQANVYRDVRTSYMSEF